MLSSKKNIHGKYDYLGFKPKTLAITYTVLFLFKMEIGYEPELIKNKYKPVKYCKTAELIFVLIFFIKDWIYRKSWYEFGTSFTSGRHQ